MANFEDYFDFINVVEEELENEPEDRLPKRYIRDTPNPFEFYSESEFKRRYRFSKHTVRDVLLPLVSEGHMLQTSRGLPVSPINQLFAALTFFGTGEFQVSSLVYHFICIIHVFLFFYSLLPETYIV